MPKNRIGVSFDGFEKMAAKYEQLGGNLRGIVAECLEKSHAHITPNLHADMKGHHRSGDTENSISDQAHVEWSGTVGSVDIGFRIRNGGLPSIFLMYGTPRMKKDAKLYNDVYGSATRKEIGSLQEEIFRTRLDEIMGGG